MIENEFGRSGMAGRGSKKARSEAQENWIASRYNGVVTKNSGAGVGEKGDVRIPDALVECKCTGSPGEKEIRTPKMVKDLEKVANEAWAASTEPMLALRYFLPDSPLADRDGWVDLAVRLVRDDVIRGGVVEWNRY